MPAKTKIMVPMVIIFGFLLLLSSTVQSQNLIQVKNGHPRIFITPSTLTTLQSRCANGGSHNTTYRAVKAWADAHYADADSALADSWYDVPNGRWTDHALLRFALLYLLGECDSGSNYTTPYTINNYGDRAIAIMLYIVSQGENSGRATFVALAYDWVYPRLSSGNKATIVNWFYSNTYCGDTPSINTNAPAGYFFLNTPPALWAALAFHGDGVSGTYGGKTADQLANVYEAFIGDTWLPAFRPMAHQAGSSSGFACGVCGYGNLWETGAYYTTYDLYAAATATDLGIAGTFNTYGIQQKYYPIYQLYNILPGDASSGRWGGYYYTFIKTEDCGNWMWNGYPNDKGLASQWRVLANVYNLNGETANAQLLTWMINNRFGYTSVDNTLDIIFNDKTISAVSPTTLGTPKSKAFGWNTSTGTIDSYLTNAKAGMGEVVMRSDWRATGSYFFDASTTQAMFRAFPYYYFGHQHFDSLAFSIFKGEPLALSSAGKYYFNYEGGGADSAYIGTPHHWQYYDRLSSNTLLILDPSEQIIGEDYGPTAYNIFKDGGQRSSVEAAFGWGDIVDGVVAGKKIRDWGGLIKYEDGTNYTYTSADATKGYNSTVGGVNYITLNASPKTTLVQRDFVYSKSSDGNSDYFVVFDRVNSINAAHKKVFLLHTVGEPTLYNGGNPATTSVVHGKSDKTAGIISSTNTDTFVIKKATGATAQLFAKTLLPTSTTVYKSGGSVTTTTTQSINNTDGATIGGSPIASIGVTSAAEFSTSPVVTIDYEAFYCESKTANTLVNCRRGQRYDKHNPPAAHNSGATVTQVYTWVNREVYTNNWISYPHDYGDIHNNSDILKDADEFGRWSLRIESGGTENNTNFLHVLFPTTNLSQVMPETILINSTSGNMKGAIIKDPVNPRIVMFSPTTAQISDVTYDANYLSSQTAKHLMTGLVPLAGYDIYKNGSKVTSSTASLQGIIYFESTGGATFRLFQTSGPVPPSSDTIPPSSPTTLTASAISSSQINLSWAASTDNVGVTGYRIYRNNVEINTSLANSYQDTGLAASTAYSYTVAAYDAAGNVSDPSNQASATTGTTADTTPPVRSNGLPSGALGTGTTQTTLSLTTNENATCKYSTIANTAYSSMPSTFITTGGTNHSATISGLLNGQSYNYYVRCQDSSNNPNADDFAISFSVSNPINPPPPGYVINDFNFYPTPNIPKPAKGVTFQDPTFHTYIKRITNAPTDCHGTYSDYCQPGYPKWDIENADASKLLIQSSGGESCWNIWNANSPFNFIMAIPYSLVNQGAPVDTRWDATDPDIIYFSYFGKFRKYSVSGNSAVTLHDFTLDYGSQCSNNLDEEGKPSADSRYWAFTIRCNYPPQYNVPEAIVVYDKDFYSKDNGKIIATLPSTDPKFVSPNYVSMTPSGNYVWLGGGGYPHTVLYPKDFSSKRELFANFPGSVQEHSDVGYADDGTEVMFAFAHFNSPDEYWYIMADLADGTVTKLVPSSSADSGGYHVSALNWEKRGWGLVSVYLPTYPTTPSVWSQHSVFMVELTKRIANPDLNNHARAWMLAQTHTLRKGYNDDPFAKINRAGTKVWFGSGWDTSISDPGTQYDVYQIDLPSTWYQDLMGGNTPPALPKGLRIVSSP